LSEHFALSVSFSDRLDPPADVTRDFTKSLGDILRRGWISDLLPRNLKQAENESRDIEHDPMSVRIVRLLGLLKDTAWTANRLLARVFATPPEHPPNVFLGDPLLARSEKQQQLIFYLSSQVDDLRRTQEELAKTQLHKQLEQATLSDETAQEYETLLRERGKDLVANAARLQKSSPARKQKEIHSELRRAVARLLQSDPAIGDRQLAMRLREATPVTDPHTDPQSE
jgi:hypothetical protein